MREKGQQHQQALHILRARRSPASAPGVDDSCVAPEGAALGAAFSACAKGQTGQRGSQPLRAMQHHDSAPGEITYSAAIGLTSRANVAAPCHRADRDFLQRCYKRVRNGPQRQQALQEEGQQRQQALHLLRAMRRSALGSDVPPCWADVGVCEEGQQCPRASRLLRVMRCSAIASDVSPGCAVISAGDAGRQRQQA